MVQLVVVNGMPTSGKSTFVGYCLKSLGAFGREVSTVDFVKDVATMCGWNGQKTPHDRKFLSDLKNLLSKWNDVPYRKVVECKERFERDLSDFDLSEAKAFLFVHSREPKEIERFKKEFGAITVLVRRESVESNEQSNSSDANVFNFKYDYVVNNNDGLKELNRQAIGFVNLLKI